MLRKILSGRLFPTIASIAILCAFLFLFCLQQGLEYLRESRIDMQPGFSSLARWEQADYDLQLRFQKSKRPSDKVVILTIDEASLQRFGRFPFSRTVYVEMLKRIREAGGKVLAFDMSFAEPEVFSNKNLILQSAEPLIGVEQTKKLGEILDAVQPDQLLARELAVGSPKVVLGYSFSTENIDPSFKDPRADNLLTTLGGFGNRGEALAHAADRPALPEPKLFLNDARYQPKLGFFNSLIDNDGVTRRVTPVLNYKDDYAAMLGIKAVQEYLATELKYLAGDKIVFGDHEHFLPVNNAGEAYISFYGPQYPFATYELVDLFSGKIGARELSGKIIFLGATALGLNDIRSTPLVAAVPGVQVHATIVSNILEKHFIQRGRAHMIFGLLALVVGGALVSVVSILFSPLLTMLFGLLSAFVVSAIATYALKHGQWLPVLLPLTCYGSIFLSSLVLRFLQIDRERKFVRDAFSRYVSRSVVDEIIKNPQALCLSGEKRDLSVLFADLKGFTTLSEHMDASMVAELLNDFFSAMTEIVLEHGGTIDKFMGDALMCFWGAPLANQEHARAACETALAMQERLSAKNTEWQSTYNVTLQMRIGINSGAMSVGNMGSKSIFSYTVVGDQVNLASRLEAANIDYGTSILVGDNTATRLKQDFVFRMIDERTLRGRSQNLAVFELVGRRPQAQRTMDWIACYERALLAFRNQSWIEAEQSIELSLQIKPEDLAAQGLQRQIRERQSVGDEVQKFFA